MYLLALIALLVAGAALANAGLVRGRTGLVWMGCLVGVGTLALFAGMDLWAEGLWFHAVGYGPRFWIFIAARAATVVAGAVIAAAAVLLLNTPARRLRPVISPWVELAAAVAGGVWGFRAWEPALLFLNRTSAGVTEPILGLDAGFYLFTLPFLESLFYLGLWLLVVAAAGAVLVILLELQERALDVRHDAALGLLIGAGALIDLLHLLYSDLGVTAGPGWTDAKVRLPGYLVLALASVTLGAAPLAAGLRRWTFRRLGYQSPVPSPALVTAAASWGALLVLWIAIAELLPATLQALVVVPNEISFEKPYIANNIRLTRYAFGLDRIEEHRYPVDRALTAQGLEHNRDIISEIRLWDWRALKAVYKQFQELRVYYELVDVDVDRYRLGDRYRQVMISAREMSQDSLPAQSQTFVNRRFIYTHGYGLTLATVSDFTPEGLPNLLVKDIPPVSKYPSLTVKRPEIYYGELTDDPVVVDTEQRELDHPSGDRNVYVHYAGHGGVEIRNWWRRLLLGWRLDSTRFLLSTYPRPKSRVMLHRQVSDRVHTLAPFLTLDADPYLVLLDGRLYWIFDAYTTSDHFPYSEPFAAPAVSRGGADRAPEVDYLDGVDYLRNSVKVVVDAYEGTVHFYVFDPQDPIIRAWEKALPGMFKPREAMPAGLRAHVRYPQGLLLTQGLVYAKYHMVDPEVFYNQEDLWVRATEKHYAGIAPVEPYYVMWQPPDSDQAQFVLVLPFTPKNRQVLIGWIAGLCDGEDYGRFLAYEFPKDRLVLGPQQVESKIDQDSWLAGQLTLWDQRGSNVLRGNVLAIPLDNSLLYVEPIYLQAETAAYPELRLVAVMNGDKLSYAKTFDAALRGLFGEGGEAPPGSGAEPASLRQTGARANAAFERYLKAQGEGRFKDAAEALTELRSLLSRFTEGASPSAGAGQPDGTP